MNGTKVVLAGCGKRPPAAFSHRSEAPPYGPGKRLFLQAMGGRVKTEYHSPLRSLRPCPRRGASRRAGVGRVRLAAFCASCMADVVSNLDIRDGYRRQNEFFRRLLGQTTMVCSVHVERSSTTSRLTHIHEHFCCNCGLAARSVNRLCQVCLPSSRPSAPVSPGDSAISRRTVMNNVG